MRQLTVMHRQKGNGFSTWTLVAWLCGKETLDSVWEKATQRG